MLRFGAQIAKISNRRKYPLYGILDYDTSNLGYQLNLIERKGRTNLILENL